MRSWLQKVIVGFELCPFARPVLPKTRVFVSHSARDSQQFWDELLVEVRSLDGATDVCCVLPFRRGCPNRLIIALEHV